ncbi:MAG: carbon storage regulator [Gemmataceae bacterium]
MLVLSRKQNEEVVINGNITVRVVGIKGNQVRLAFSAPLDVEIYRSEIVESATSFREPEKAVIVPSSRERLRGSPGSARTQFSRKAR